MVMTRDEFIRKKMDTAALRGGGPNQITNVCFLLCDLIWEVKQTNELLISLRRTFGRRKEGE